MMFQKSVVRPVQLILAVALMLGSVGASEWAKPTKHWSDALGHPHYDTLVPKQFGSWVALPDGSKAVVNPVQAEELMRLYTETLARSYLHKPTGRVLMLSLAYGKDQSTDTQIHAPESCYASQGFRVESQAAADINTPYGTIPAVRLKTVMGTQRPEPITYFIRVGDGMARGSKDRNLARLKMAMHGYLIDGLLFRVSEITQADDAYALQERFIRDLLESVDAHTRRRLIGASPDTDSSSL